MDVYTHFWNVCHIYAFRSVVYIPFRRGLLRVVCSDDSGMRRPQRLRTGNAGVHALLNALKTFLSYPCLSAADAKRLRQTKTTDEDDRQTALQNLWRDVLGGALPHVLYFKADDHYTHVYTDSGTHMVMPFGLSKVETAIAQRLPENNFLLRLGRSHIVNIQYIYHVNMLKQSVLLADSHGQMHPLHFSRQVLQSLMEHLER